MATSGKDFRLESDLIGERQISNEHLYGVQTLRGIENFNISNFHLCDYPLFIHGLAWTKEAAAIANHRLGLLTDQQKDAIVQACHELLEGKHHQHFPVDMIQGGAGTTANMPIQSFLPLSRSAIKSLKAKLNWLLLFLPRSVCWRKP